MRPHDQTLRSSPDSVPQARELEWLLISHQETLVSWKAGLEECYALLAAIEPGSTLVMSSPRSEAVKGHITRVGTQVTRGVGQVSSPMRRARE